MDLREQSYGKAGYHPSGAADDLFPGTFYLAEVRVCGSKGWPLDGNGLKLARVRKCWLQGTRAFRAT